MLNYLYFALLALFWGGSFVAIKNLIGEIPSFTSAFYRVLFSVLFLSIIYIKKLNIDFKNDLAKKEILNSAIAGLCSIGIPFAFLFWGELHTSPSLAAIINGTVPLWTMIIGILFFNGAKEVTRLKLVGLVLGITGIVIIFFPKIKFSGSDLEIYGLISIMFMAIFYAIGINLNKTLLSGHKYILGSRNTIIQQLSSLVLLFVLTLAIDGVPEVSKIMNLSASGSIIYLSLFSTCFAFIIFYKLIEHFGAVKASTVTFFVPAVALILDGIIYNRSLELYESTGAATIFLSMYFLKDRKIT
ncbi:DMT family transporter [Bacteriovorax sp. Seq25_V]|uniref:DMT family transporter n=1 Tax=Bacteriovorax sp. Seq25_V TaxID=1201288 RepID=UPI00038A061D|nr:DMT family transporter [Bacteriovorax sp. Seq25_V]EQC45452.1 EamA-like transporter family protein [Bacteriovorax sp. Seq25_V]